MGLLGRCLFARAGHVSLIAFAVFLPLVSVGCQSAEVRRVSTLQSEPFPELSSEQQARLWEAKSAVVKVWGTENVFSAVCIAENRGLSAWHAVGKLSLPSQLLLARALTSPPSEEDFSAVRLVSVSTVGGEAPNSIADDWVELRFDTQGLTQLALNRAASLRSGEVLYVIGYPERVGNHYQRAVVAIPARLSHEDGPQVFLVLPSSYSHDLSGVSGGAIVRWNASRQTFECVAIAIGMISLNGGKDFPILKGVRPSE